MGLRLELLRQEALIVYIFQQLVKKQSNKTKHVFEFVPVDPYRGRGELPGNVTPIILAPVVARRGIFIPIRDQDRYIYIYKYIYIYIYMKYEASIAI